MNSNANCYKWVQNRTNRKKRKEEKKAANKNHQFNASHSVVCECVSLVGLVHITVTHTTHILTVCVCVCDTVNLFIDHHQWFETLFVVDLFSINFIRFHQFFIHSSVLLYCSWFLFRIQINQHSKRSMLSPSCRHSTRSWCSFPHTHARIHHSIEWNI